MLTKDPLFQNNSRIKWYLLFLKLCRHIRRKPNSKYPIDTSPDIIQLPESIGTFVCNIDELVSKVYPDLLSNFRNMAWLSERCILAPLNESTRAINTALVAHYLVSLLSTDHWILCLMNPRLCIFL